jgi:hypothetical protein
VLVEVITSSMHPKQDAAMCGGGVFPTFRVHGGGRPERGHCLVGHLRPRLTIGVRSIGQSRIVRERV